MLRHRYTFAKIGAGPPFPKDRENFIDGVHGVTLLFELRRSKAACE
jgi:hypothetical protein